MHKRVARQVMHCAATLSLVTWGCCPQTHLGVIDRSRIAHAQLNPHSRVTHVFYRKAYLEGKKEKPPFVKSSSPERRLSEEPVPEELLCHLCKDIVKDAVVTPCCANSYCDECE